MAITCTYVFSVWIHLSLVHYLVSGQGISEQKFIVKTSSDCVSHDCLGLIGEELECTNGFPSMRDVKGQMTDGIQDFNSVRLIPEMNFTCSGTIVQVIVAGRPMQRDSEDNPQHVRLQIWRSENTTEHGIGYYRIQNIALPPSICERMGMLGDVRTFICTLKTNMQIPVEPGDILGIGLPPKPKANFELYSVTESRLTNYIFERGLESTTLSNRTSKTTVQPLIRVKIDQSGPGMYDNNCNRSMGQHCMSRELTFQLTLMPCHVLLQIQL